MNQLVCINIVILIFLDLFYLIEKVAQHHSFKDLTSQVEEVLVVEFEFEMIILKIALLYRN